MCLGSDVSLYFLYGTVAVSVILKVDNVKRCGTIKMYLNRMIGSFQDFQIMLQYINKI